ncbi:hypothetical protein IWQ62_000898 [Dispira parvispora]|uniref:Galactose oxidase n=1 Tax=Dispira parvispora TaxID=1520584 RepID=A0A9W8ATT8_9FUNG|nr:hypothetical protein IWQ62_000898 [Dispira parvispora]
MAGSSSSYILIHGGLTDPDESNLLEASGSSDVLLFDTKENNWYQPSMDNSPKEPQKLHSCATNADLSKVFFYNAYRGADDRSLLFTLDSNHWTWSNVDKSNQAPSQRQGAAVALVDSKLYMHGGQPIDSSNSLASDTANNDLNHLDTVSLDWSSQANGPSLMYHTSCYISDTNSIIYYGGGSQDTSSSNSIYVYSLSAKTWNVNPTIKNKGSSPSPRAFHSAVCQSNQMIMFGGSDSYTGSTPIDSTVWILTATSKDEYEWSQAPISSSSRTKGPSARFGHSAVLNGDNMYIYGGFGTDGDTNVYILDTNSWEWTVVSVTNRGAESSGGANNSTVLIASIVSGVFAIIAMGIIAAVGVRNWRRRKGQQSPQGDDDEGGHPVKNMTAVEALGSSRDTKKESGDFSESDSALVSRSSASDEEYHSRTLNPISHNNASSGHYELMTLPAGDRTMRGHQIKDREAAQSQDPTELRGTTLRPPSPSLAGMASAGRPRLFSVDMPGTSTRRSTKPQDMPDEDVDRWTFASSMSYQPREATSGVVDPVAPLRYMQSPHHHGDVQRDDAPSPLDLERPPSALTDVTNLSRGRDHVPIAHPVTPPAPPRLNTLFASFQPMSPQSASDLPSSPTYPHFSNPQEPPPMPRSQSRRELTSDVLVSSSMDPFVSPLDKISRLQLDHVLMDSRRASSLRDTDSSQLSTTSDQHRASFRTLPAMWKPNNDLDGPDTVDGSGKLGGVMLTNDKRYELEVGDTFRPTYFSGADTRLSAGDKLKLEIDSIPPVPSSASLQTPRSLEFAPSVMLHDSIRRGSNDIDPVKYRTMTPPTSMYGPGDNASLLLHPRKRVTSTVFSDRSDFTEKRVSIRALHSPAETPEFASPRSSTTTTNSPAFLPLTGAVSDDTNTLSRGGVVDRTLNSDNAVFRKRSLHDVTRLVLECDPNARLRSVGKTVDGPMGERGMAANVPSKPGTPSLAESEYVRESVDAATTNTEPQPTLVRLSSVSTLPMGKRVSRMTREEYLASGDGRSSLKRVQTQVKRLLDAARLRKPSQSSLNQQSKSKPTTPSSSHPSNGFRRSGETEVPFDDGTHNTPPSDSFPLDMVDVGHQAFTPRVERHSFYASEPSHSNTSLPNPSPMNTLSKPPRLSIVTGDDKTGKGSARLLTYSDSAHPPLSALPPTLDDFPSPASPNNAFYPLLGSSATTNQGIGEGDGSALSNNSPHHRPFSTYSGHRLSIASLSTSPFSPGPLSVRNHSDYSIDIHTKPEGGTTTTLSTS